MVTWSWQIKQVPVVTQKDTGTISEPVTNCCPLCGKDMTIRPGQVFDCRRDVCAYWRLTW